MEAEQRLKVKRNGSINLPAAVREEAGISAGDLLDVKVRDNAIVLVKPEPEYHYAKWRSISHDLIMEKQQELV
jgi:AbrB family looped-hinge helix DNA binding protein